MPLITFAYTKEVIANLETRFDVDETNFSALEKDASERVAEITGITIPDNANESPNWSKIPTVWILLYIIITRNATVKPEDIETARRYYQDALDILNKHIVKASNSPAGLFSSGTITERYTW
jgi:hypothetical protein